MAILKQGSFDELSIMEVQKVLLTHWSLLDNFAHSQNAVFQNISIFFFFFMGAALNLA